MQRGVDLAGVVPDRPVRTEDTFATACDFLGVPVDPALDGKPVGEISDRRGAELLVDATPKSPVDKLSPAVTPPGAAQAGAVAAAATRPAGKDLVLRPHAVVQTQMIDQAGDAADDPAVWVHPADPARSTVIGTDKKAGPCVYDLHGTLLQTVSTDCHPDNVDVLNDFDLNGRYSDLAAAGTRAKGCRGVEIWSIDPATGWLSDVTSGGVIAAFGGTEPYGSRTYRSRRDGQAY